MDQFGDVLLITTADGNTLSFSDPDVRLLAYGSLGAPPTQFITRQGYKQNSLTELDYLLQPRTITVELWHSPACDRQTYWDIRSELHDFLRPNRGGPLTFTLRTPNGDLRSIIVRADPGMVFPGSANNNNWNVQESFDFIAFDPTFFDATSTTNTLTVDAQLQLIFPIIFPITFGSTLVFLSTGTITYTGTWKSYPTITLDGPYTRAAIINTATGVQINLNVAIILGEQRIITLTPGSQSIVDALGNNQFGDLGPGSDLIDFALLPDPEVAGGIQTITVQLIDGVNGQSAASIVYANRYFAL
jgi:hypothetical protein